MLSYVNRKLLAGVSLTAMDGRVIIIACSIKQFVIEMSKHNRKDHSKIGNFQKIKKKN